MSELSTLTPGALVYAERDGGVKEVFVVLVHNNADYPDQTCLVKKECIATTYAFDAKEPNSTDGNRKSYGNNRYLYSNVLQWLNSSAAAGAWYTPQHSADQSPNSTSVVNANPYAASAGWLNGFDAKFVAALQTITQKVAKNTVTDGGGYETVTTKVHLLSATQVGLANENGIAEGVAIPYFNSDARRIAYIGTTAQHWWLRTPYSGASHSVRGAGTSGAPVGIYAYEAHGVRPALALESSIFVSDTPDPATGARELIINQPPTISGSDGDLGTKSAAFTQSYSVTDAESDAVTVTEKLDGTTLRTYSATLGATNTVTIDAARFLRLTNAQHTITITAADAGGSTTRTWTFTKSVTTATVQFAAAKAATSRPTRCKVFVKYTAPAGAVLTVQACNNGNDASPTWETITPNQNCTLTNTLKTASAWGFNVRVSLDRQDTEGDCCIELVASVFE